MRAHLPAARPVRRDVLPLLLVPDRRRRPGRRRPAGGSGWRCSPRSRRCATGWYAAGRAGVGPKGRLRAGTVMIARGEFSIVIAALGAEPRRRARPRRARRGVRAAHRDHRADSPPSTPTGSRSPLPAAVGLSAASRRTPDNPARREAARRRSHPDRPVEELADLPLPTLQVRTQDRAACRRRRVRPCRPRSTRRPTRRRQLPAARTFLHPLCLAAGATRYCRPSTVSRLTGVDPDLSGRAAGHLEHPRSPDADAEAGEPGDDRG